MPDPLHGPPFALPRRLDRALDRWARLPPRVRVLVAVGVLLVFGVLQAQRLDAAVARWGGQGEPVWRAVATTPAGQAPQVRQVRLPRAAVPDTAVIGRLPDDAVLSLPLVDGAILTEVHLDPAGPVVGLAADERLVPVPVDRDLGVEAGSVVDVWPVVDGRGADEPLATARPVLLVRPDGTRPVALVSRPADVAAATAALARGRLLLTLRG